MKSNWIKNQPVLLPCPFCGATQEEGKVGLGYYSAEIAYAVKCEGCKVTNKSRDPWQYGYFPWDGPHEGRDYTNHPRVLHWNKRA